MIEEYLNEDWRDILRFNKAETFEQLWALNRGEWFEPPNNRRGGWSGVVRHVLRMPDGREVGVFIKCQENHGYRSWKNFFRISATFEREFRNLQRCQRLGIPTLEPVYFGQRIVEGGLRAILVTRELEGYRPFDASCYTPISKLERSRRKKIFERVGAALRKMHCHNIQYNCLYLKHIFIKEDVGGSVDVRLIDMEKAKWRPCRKFIAVRDWYSLHRRAVGWSRTDRLRLFLAYREEDRLSTESKKIVKAILRRMNRKGRILQ
jgi:hypothetical protein